MPAYEAKKRRVVADATVATTKRVFREYDYECYLLLSTTRNNKIYIGSTFDTPRRLLQHNGHNVGGAKKTVKDRPWVFACIVSGFPSRHHALQFEWAWQHPRKSRLLKTYRSQHYALPLVRYCQTLKQAITALAVLLTNTRQEAGYENLVAKCHHPATFAAVRQLMDTAK